jgi:signal transduction histidine kinase
MQYRPLSRRIIIAFVLMVVVVSSIFSAGIILAVRYVEKQLIADNLHADLAIAIADFNAGRDIQLQPDSSFYYSDKDNPAADLHAPPKWIENLKSGINEFTREDQIYKALVYRQDSEQFMILKNQTDLEKRERVLFFIVLVGFVFSVAAAWILGYLLARRIMEPVRRLADQVNHQEQGLLMAKPLASGYAEDEVGRLAVAFDNTLDKLRNALERERFFTSDVSHELRTPLTVIATSSELLMASNALSGKQQEQLQRIQRACEEMRELVHTFLLLARDNLTQETSTEKRTLLVLAEEQVQRWTGIAQVKGLRMELLQEAESTDVFNAPLLRSVLANLLRNAVHYTDSGFVRLVIGDGVFRVEDSGRGIEETEQEAIFRPFVRGTGARGEGLGLGLSLVKRICAHQEWHITLSNRQPHGSCFTVQMKS